jgi:hypothetical protein
MPANPEPEAARSAEELRRVHIRTLEALQDEKKKCARFEAELLEERRIAKANPKRMTPEELNSTYVEEQRQIEELTREVTRLRDAQQGAKDSAVGAVATAKADAERARRAAEDAKAQMKRQAAEAALKLEQVRDAFKRELEGRASECEAAKAAASRAATELTLEAARANSLEAEMRKLIAARDGSLAAAQARKPPATTPCAPPHNCPATTL